MLCSQWVMNGTSSGVSKLFLLFRRSCKSSRGSPTQPGTLINASTFLCKFLSLFRRFNDSRNTSIPLFLNSYLPLVPTINVSSPRFVPNNLFATFNIKVRARLRFPVNVLPFGTKSSSKPFIRITSAGLSSNSLHSLLVISLTVVKQST